jgi:hypothetical protein
LIKKTTFLDELHTVDGRRFYRCTVRLNRDGEEGEREVENFVLATHRAILKRDGIERLGSRSSSKGLIIGIIMVGVPLKAKWYIIFSPGNTGKLFGIYLAIKSFTCALN